jgi:hypothetical protein
MFATIESEEKAILHFMLKQHASRFMLISLIFLKIIYLKVKYCEVNKDISLHITNDVNNPRKLNYQKEVKICKNNTVRIW